jgi:hypothetical protein
VSLASIATLRRQVAKLKAESVNADKASVAEQIRAAEIFIYLYPEHRDGSHFNGCLDTEIHRIVVEFVRKNTLPEGMKSPVAAEVPTPEFIPALDENSQPLTFELDIGELR